MAEQDPLKRYFSVAQQLRSNQEVNDKDIEFFLSYSPKIDQEKLNKLVKNGNAVSVEDAKSALLEAGRALQSSPDYKNKTLQIAQEAAKGRLSADLATGINLVLAGSDIAQSVQQIQASNRGLAASRKPSRPVAPRRDQMLADALRQSQEGTMNAGRALAPVQANIADQYQADITNARTAATGQAGAFGSYAQLAANRRNRSAMELAPLQDQIRRQDQARTDELLGMRQAETQQIFENDARFYPQDMYQYNLEQNAAASLGATGRENLRNSLYGFGQQVAPVVADYYTERKYRDLRNRAAAAYGPDFAETAVNARQYLDDQWNPRKGPAIADYWVEDPMTRSSSRSRYTPTI